MIVAGLDVTEEDLAELREALEAINEAERQAWAAIR